MENIYITVWQIYSDNVYRIFSELAKFYGRYNKKTVWCVFSVHSVYVFLCVCETVSCIAGSAESIQVFLVGCGAGLGRRTTATGHYVLQYVNCYYHPYHCQHYTATASAANSSVAGQGNVGAGSQC